MRTELSKACRVQSQVRNKSLSCLSNKIAACLRNIQIRTRGASQQGPLTVRPELGEISVSRSLS